LIVVIEIYLLESITCSDYFVDLDYITE